MSTGVYIHIPYCPAICPYCDFNVAVRKAVDWDGFVHAVSTELDARAALFPRMLQSIYFGGGTPSLAPPEVIGALADKVRSLFVGIPREVTLEANPGTVSLESLRGYREAGVTRLSLGWQSTHDHLLKLLGRTHSAAESAQAAVTARLADFDNLSVDLIFAVPGQTLVELEADLDAVLALAPEHVSLYGLTYHENTPFWRSRALGNITPVDDAVEAAMFERISERLVAAGYAHYEISNFARSGHEALHNASYWNGTPYLGAGPGAHSFMRDGWNRGWRWETLRNPDRYIASMAQPRIGRPSPGDAHVTFVEELTRIELARERVLTGLRLEAGIDVTVEPFTGQALENGIAYAVAQGLATFDGRLLVPTAAGRLRADDLAVLVAP
ncbi:MAG: radical SAM family heme chaperone HemW [Clostridia bacterium]|nr:radical SAM family heme chaperone HemW [Deltaproteobacteria bacterium]